MAITVNLNTLQKLQQQGSPYGTTDFLQVCTLNMDNSYPAGGYPITPSQFNLNGILGLIQIGYPGGATPTIFMFDPLNSTLRAFWQAATAGAATITNLREVAAGNAGLQNVSPTFVVFGV